MPFATDMLTNSTVHRRRLTDCAIKTAAAAGAVAAFVAVVSTMYRLHAIFGFGTEAFPPVAPGDWLGPSVFDFGADFIVHAIPMGFIFFGMAMLLPALATRPTRTFLGSFAVSVAWHVIGFNWYLEPHEVLSDPVDDVLIISSLILTFMHILIAIRARGTARIRSIISALAMGAAIIETVVVHALVIMPSAQVYGATAGWLKTAAENGVDHRAICRKAGLTCLRHDTDRFKVDADASRPGVPDVVAERALEAVKKYGIADLEPPPKPRTWVFRHRSFDNYTGSLRMPAVEFMDRGERVIIVDTAYAPVANFWVRSFTHLHFLPLCIVWSILIVMINAIHGRSQEAQ